ncbi:MAG TPA: hypothetical protein VLZ75_14935 [Chitinophagales bacterium]|nr:hypothetical protein [Chitinophagales bacterium]
MKNNAFIKILTILVIVFTSHNISAQIAEIHSVKLKTIKDSLEVLDNLAKIEYQEMRTHPKLLSLKQIEEYSKTDKLASYKKIVFNFDSKAIEFNSLFVKTIVENPSIYHFYFSPTIAILWTDYNLNTEKLLEHLNEISMTPIYQNNISNSIK